MGPVYRSTERGGRKREREREREGGGGGEDNTIGYALIHKGSQGIMLAD